MLLKFRTLDDKYKKVILKRDFACARDIIQNLSLPLSEKLRYCCNGEYWQYVQVNCLLCVVQAVNSNEPAHEIVVLFVLHKLILQMRMHPVGLDIWFLVGPFVYFSTSCVRTAKALARLRGCAGSPEPLLVANVISTIISWAGSNDLLKTTDFYRKLGATGQRVGAAGAICHIRKPTEDNKHYQLHVANVGDTEVVVCRRGEAVCLSKLFTVSRSKEEMRRICKVDGIITEVP